MAHLEGEQSPANRANDLVAASSEHQGTTSDEQALQPELSPEPGILQPEPLFLLEAVRAARASLKLAQESIDMARPGAEKDAAKLRLRQAQREHAVALEDFKAARRQNPDKHPRP